MKQLNSAPLVGKRSALTAKEVHLPERLFTAMLIHLALCRRCAPTNTQAQPPAATDARAERHLSRPVGCSAMLGTDATIKRYTTRKPERTPSWLLLVAGRAQPSMLLIR
ncbi:MAG: hypothetical protein ACREV0_09135, partial [Burkholderiales bacterium]